MEAVKVSMLSNGRSSIWGNIVMEAVKSSICGNIVMPAVKRSIWGNVKQLRVLFVRKQHCYGSR